MVADWAILWNSWVRASPDVGFFRAIGLDQHWISTTSTTWELDRNAQSQTPPQTYRIRIRRREPAICVLSSSQRLEAASKYKNHCSKGFWAHRKTQLPQCYRRWPAKKVNGFLLYYSFHSLGSLSSTFILLHIQWMGLLPVLASACKEDPTLYYLGLWFL